jgi:IclR family pca regulon transcriptional regulator
MKLVESVRKGLEVMEAFSSHKPRLRLQEVARLTGQPKATAYRLLRTLMALGYVNYDKSSMEFYLGPRVMSLGFTVLSSLDLRELSQPYLEDLSFKTGQNVNLGLLDRAEVIYVERIKKRQILNIDLFVGSRLPAHSSSIGQAILAFLSEDKLQAAIDVMLADEVAAAEIGQDGFRLKEKLAEVRGQGYALNDQDSFIGLRAVAAPLFDREGNVEAAVNVAAFSQLTSREELMEKHLPWLLTTVTSISRSRGFRAEEQLPPELNHPV